MAAEGQQLSIAEYPELFDVIGHVHGGLNTDYFFLPDTRGLFVRGVDGGRGADPDVASRIVGGGKDTTAEDVGSFQVDMFKSHTHRWRNGHNLGLSSTYSAHAPGPHYSSPETTASGGNETRPKNIYAYKIIRVK